MKNEAEDRRSRRSRHGRYVLRDKKADIFEVNHGVIL